MSATRPGAILRRLHDADDAFAALVRRHGPMVLAVCRRITGNRPDAEDAFQATFLVLARSAGTVRNPERLGSWLYGVAVKVAGRARRTALRRKRRETTVAAFPDVPAPDPPPPLDVGPALHEELAALPPHHRDAIVLCDLQGLSRADAAKALGVAEGTLSSRLANGRKRLAERLTRRGVTLGAATIPAVLAEGRAAVPDDLFSNTCGLAAAWAAGVPLPAAVARLARGGFPMRGVLLGGVLTLSLAAGAVLAAGFTDPPAPAEPPAAPVAVAQPEPKEPPKKDDFDPTIRPYAKLRHRSDLTIRQPRNLSWSGDGKLLAIQGQRPDGDAAGAMAKLVSGASDFLVVPADFTDVTGELYPLPPRGALVGFLPGDKQLLTLVRESGLISGASTLVVWHWEQLPRLGLRGFEGGFRRGESVPIPEDGYQFTPAADGKTIRYLVVESGTPVPQFSIGAGTLTKGEFADGKRSGPVVGPFRALMITPDAGRVATVTDAGAVEAYGANGKKLWATEPTGPKGAFGPEGGPTHYAALAAARDGSRVLVARGFAPPAVLDLATGKARPALEGAEPSERATRVQAAVSANGRLAALLYTPAVPRPNPFGAGQLGGNPQPKGTGGPRGLMGKGEPKLVVWDTATGKVVRSWRGEALALAFHPTQQRLAILESNGGGTRLGLWDFPWEFVEE